MADLNDIGADVAEIKTALLGGLDGKPGMIDRVRRTEEAVERIDEGTRYVQAFSRLPAWAQLAVASAGIAMVTGTSAFVAGRPIAPENIVPALVALEEQRRAETAAIKRDSMEEALEHLREGSGQ